MDPHQFDLSPRVYPDVTNVTADTSGLWDGTLLPGGPHVPPALLTSRFPPPTPVTPDGMRPPDGHCPGDGISPRSEL